MPEDSSDDERTAKTSRQRGPKRRDSDAHSSDDGGWPEERTASKDMPARKGSKEVLHDAIRDGADAVAGIAEALTKPSGTGAGAAKDAVRSGGGGLFGGVKAKGDEIREQLLKKEYNVMDYYKEKGPIQKIAKHGLFENFTLFIIFVNAIWIGVDTDYNYAEEIQYADMHYRVMENAFCTYFSAEVAIRFMAFQEKYRALQDMWFKFDSALVSLMILETWIMPVVKSYQTDEGENSQLSQLSILRLLRLLRLTRMVRLMRAVPELVTLIKGMAKAGRSVGSTLLLLIIVLYVFGIIFAGMLGNVPAEECPDCRMMFGNITKSMFTLFLAGTLLDNVTAVLMNFRDTHTGMLFAFLIYVLMSSFTILNMLIGVLCEVVSAVAAEEGEKAMVLDTQGKLRQVYLMGDEDGSGTISHDEFEKMSDHRSVLDALGTIGVEPKHFSALASVLFEDESNPGKTRSLSFEDFVRQIVMLRPEKAASVMDVADLRFCLRSDVKFCKESHDEVLDEINEAQSELETYMDKLIEQLLELDERMTKVEDYNEKQYGTSNKS